MIQFNDEDFYTENFPTNDFLSLKNGVEINLSKRQWIDNSMNGNMAEPINNANPVVNNNVNDNFNNMGSTLIPNPDCHNISDLLNDLGLDYGWKNTNDCCSFNRITCVDPTGTPTQQTTADTKITELFFNNIKLNGSIPTSLCSLINLKVLQFVKNTGLTGSIPPCIGGMSKLEKLVFSNTPIQGEIPKSISAVSTLQYLSIENTNIQSTIPEEITNLSNLMKLYINNNPNVRGEIPKGLSKLSKLEMLSFSDSNIGGSLPEDIGKLTNLKTLSVHHTNVGGKIPDSIGDLPNLQTIKFHDTKISGKLPDSFKNLKNLKTLTLNNTSIEGAVPDDFKSIVFEECSFDKTNLCVSSDTIKNDKNTPACMKTLSVCTGAMASGGENSQNVEDGMSFMTYCYIFFTVLIITAICVFFYKRYKNRKTFEHEKRAINYYKNNVTEQPKWFGNNIFQKQTMQNDIQAYNCLMEQNIDQSAFNKDTSFFNRFFEGIHPKNNNNYQKLNESQFGDINNTYLIRSDTTFQYNTIGMEDMKQVKQINEDGSLKNIDETFVNRNRVEVNYEYDNMNKSISQKSLDSEKTEIEANRAYENMGNARMGYNDSIYKGNSSSGSSSIPLPPNSDNMVFMGREAQEELKLFQQKNNLSFSEEENKSVKEQLEELEQMASSNYNTSRKSPRTLSKSPRSFKSPKSPSQLSNKNDLNMSNINGNKSADINDQILELKFTSFNGLDLNMDNFNNSRTFDNIEKKFINNLNSLRKNTTTADNNPGDDSVDTVEGDTTTATNNNNNNDKDKDSKTFTFANIPGLQIQEYYNQINLSESESKTSSSDWGVSKSMGNNDEEKKFDKIIPSGIFTTNKTSWDTTEDESFFSNESSFRNTTNTNTRSEFNNTTSTMNSSTLNKMIKSKLGTESMLREGVNYDSQSSDSSGDDGYNSRYTSGVTEDSRYRSGITEDSRYRSGVTATDDGYGYSKYSSGVTDDKYKSGFTTDDGGYSRYKSGLTAATDEGYSKYSSIDQSKFKSLSIDPSALESINFDRNSKFNSDFSGFPNVVVTDTDGKKLSTDTKKTDSTRYTSSTNNTADTITKDYTLSTDYSSTGYTLSNANTLSSGFTLDSSVKTNSNGSSLAPPKTNSSRTTKSSSNLNIVSTLSSFSNPNTDSLFSDYSKFSSLDSMATTMNSVSSLSLSNEKSKD
jgi:hypothetical protein